LSLLSGAGTSLYLPVFAAIQESYSTPREHLIRYDIFRTFGSGSLSGGLRLSV
jgi:hypothetical protein